MRVLSYEKLQNSAVAVTDRVAIEVSEEEAESLRSAMATMERFEKLVLSEFHSARGYAANDRRHSDVFREMHFWFKDGLLMASIRHGSVG